MSYTARSAQHTVTISSGDQLVVAEMTTNQCPNNGIFLALVNPSRTDRKSINFLKLKIEQKITNLKLMLGHYSTQQSCNSSIRDSHSGLLQGKKTGTIRVVPITCSYAGYSCIDKITYVVYKPVCSHPHIELVCFRMINGALPWNPQFECLYQCNHNRIRTITPLLHVRT